MKKTLTLVSILLLVGFSLNLSAENYQLDQNKIDAMFAQAEQVSTLSVFDLSDLGAVPGTAQVFEEKDPIMAFVLCWVVGWAGAHRLYLGTETKIFIFYLLTGGGFGIVVLIDWIKLLMVVLDKEPLSPYIDNPNFIMWKGQDIL